MCTSGRCGGAAVPVAGTGVNSVLDATGSCGGIPRAVAGLDAARSVRHSLDRRRRIAEATGTGAAGPLRARALAAGIASGAYGTGTNLPPLPGNGSLVLGADDFNSNASATAAAEANLAGVPTGEFVTGNPCVSYNLSTGTPVLSTTANGCPAGVGTNKVTRTVFVDGNYGNDVTGQTENPERPFQTYAAAVAAIGNRATPTRRWSVQVRSPLYEPVFRLVNNVDVKGQYDRQSAVLGGVVDGSGVSTNNQVFVEDVTMNPFPTGSLCSPYTGGSRHQAAYIASGGALAQGSNVTFNNVRAELPPLPPRSSGLTGDTSVFRLGSGVTVLKDSDVVANFAGSTNGTTGGTCQCPPGANDGNATFITAGDQPVGLLARNNRVAMVYLGDNPLNNAIVLHKNTHPNTTLNLKTNQHLVQLPTPTSGINFDAYAGLDALGRVTASAENILVNSLLSQNPLNRQLFVGSDNPLYRGTAPNTVTGYSTAVRRANALGVQAVQTVNGTTVPTMGTLSLVHTRGLANTNARQLRIEASSIDMIPNRVTNLINSMNENEFSKAMTHSVAYHDIVNVPRHIPFDPTVDESIATNISTDSQHLRGGIESSNIRVLADTSGTDEVKHNDHVIVSVSATKTITLPSIASPGAGNTLLGAILVFKQAVEGDFTIVPQAGETIDGLSSIVLHDGQSRTIVSDGVSNWLQISRFDPDVVSANVCNC